LSKRARERNQIEVDAFRWHISQYFIWQVISLDESAFNDKTRIREYGYSRVGTRARGLVLFIRGRRYTLEFALGYQGTFTYRIYVGSMNGDDFIRFLTDDLVSLNSLTISFR
jgi:hypothetical protein